MYGGVEETQCTHCNHREVCSFKEQFLKAQNAVNEVTVGAGNHGIKYLRDFHWIKAVKLECIYFVAKQPTQRDISIAKKLYEDGKARGDDLLEGKFMEDPT